jgi:hypothetical protein
MMRAAIAAALAACGGARPAPAPAPPPEPPATGWLDDGVIDRAMSARSTAIEACYQRVLELRPGLAGKVVVRFRIGAAGGVTSAAAEGFDPSLDACVERVVRMLEVHAPHDGPVDVTYPLSFGIP